MITSFLGTLAFYGLILLVAQTIGLFGRISHH
jgi:hypothetical protein